MRAQADAIGVGDAYARGQHVVDHPRELVDAVDGDRSVGAKAKAGGLESLDGTRTGGGPHHVAEQPEDAFDREPMRRDEAVREQVQPEIDVGGIDGCAGQRLEHGVHPAHLDLATGVLADEGVEAVDIGRVHAQGRGGVPGVEQRAVGGVRRHAMSGCRERGGHAG